MDSRAEEAEGPEEAPEGVVSNRVDDLEPVTREACRRWLDACIAAGLDVKVTHTLRTLDEQGHLYAQGRTL